MSNQPAPAVTEAVPNEKKEIIPLAEINKHNTTKDMWVALNGKVYNVTKFIDEHPGGEEVLLEVAGKDCTQEFEDVGHSEYAVEILEEMLVGDGDPEELTVREKPLGVQEFEEDESSGSSSSMLYIVAALIAIIAFIYLKVLRK